MDTIIRANKIGKKVNFSDEVTLDLLTDINITFSAGKFVVLTGERGSGKSTLLGIILGYEKDYEGSIKIKDKDIDMMDENELEVFRRENIGVCYEDKTPIDMDLTVKENINNRIKIFQNELLDEKLEEIINSFNLYSIENKEVIFLSSLELYKAMLAMAFCGPPPIIIIDEFLDYFELDERRELLKNMLALQNKYKITMLLVTHEIEIIKQAHRAINIMNKTTYEIDLNRLKEITKDE